MGKEKFPRCKIKKVGDLFEIECENGEKREKIYCVVGQKGKSGGLSVLGFGGQYGKEDSTPVCFSDKEIKDKVARKLGVKKEDILWEDYE